jgi:hypothetical protein
MAYHIGHADVVLVSGGFTAIGRLGRILRNILEEIEIDSLDTSSASPFDGSIIILLHCHLRLPCCGLLTVCQMENHPR